MAGPRPRIWQALVAFWQRDESLTLLLVLLVLFAFVLPPLVPHPGPGSSIAAGLFSLVLIAGVATFLRHRPWAVRALATLFGVTFLLRWAAWMLPAGIVAMVSCAAQTFALTALAFLVLAMVLRPGTINRRRIEGAVAAYLLLGLAWAGAYEWVWLADPAAFRGAVGSGGPQWIYYSLVTLTSTGYGDITPVHPVARSLATAEAITGQLYIAILIARLVALELHSRQPK